MAGKLSKAHVLWLLRNYGLLREGLSPSSGKPTGYTDWVSVKKGGFVKPPAFVFNAEKAAELYLRLETLEPPLSIVLLLVYSFGFTWSEIARLLKINYKTLYSQGQEAIEKLRGG